MPPVVAAFAAAGALWGVTIGVGAIVATTLGAMVVGGIVGAVVGYVFDEFFMSDITAKSATYKGRNPVYTVEEGKPIAKAYGRCQLAGNIIRSNDPGEDELKVLIGHGQGEIDSIFSWKINHIEWDYLKGVKWWLPDYIGSSHFKNTALGTDSQNIMQVDGSTLFSLDACAYRKIAHTGFKLDKNNQISGVGSILVEGRFGLCEPIGGGADVFTRNPAVVMWDFYRKIEGYAAADLDENAFKSLEALCDFYPTTGDGGPIRPPGPNNTTVKATSYRDAKKYAPFFSFDINNPLDASNKYNQWASNDGQRTNQRLNVDLGIPVVLTKIVLVNSHISGGFTTKGIQNFAIQGSNTASDLDHTAYADGASDWTDVQTGLTATQYDPADPYKSYVVTSPGTAYRYYSIKIADSHGGSTWMGVRDICFWGRSPRYTFDFNFDTEVNNNDAKKLIWSSFNGRVIRSQGKLKPVWDWKTMADGSGGLTAKTSSYSFTVDNIVKGSFIWYPRKRANKIIIEYLEASEKWKKTPVMEKDDSDIDDRGEIELRAAAYYITQQDVAARRCRRQLYRAMYADYQCKITGFPSSQKLEVYDLVEVTHLLPDWISKKFIVLDKAEDEQGRPTFLLETYYAGVFDDLETPLPPGYFPGNPSPGNIPPPSTNITATLVAPGSGYDYCAVKVSFTPPSAYYFYSHTEIYASKYNIDTTYFLMGTSSGEDFIINGMGTIYEVGDTCYIKLKNVSMSGVSEDMPTTYDAFVNITNLIKFSNFYAGLYDLWGGNTDISHADTKIVIGNLDGTPKIALGESADAITFAGTQSGFFADGDGNLRIGSSTHGLKFTAGTGVLDVSTKLKVGTGTYIDIDGSNARIRSSNYVSGYMGAGFTLEPDLLEVGNIACRGIFRTAVFQKDTISVVGGNILVRPADVLDVDMTAANNSTLTIEGNETFAVNDLLRIKDGFDDEWFKITNAASAPTYTVERDKSGNYASNSNPAWTKGASVVNYGQSGDGGLYMTASENNAPYMSIYTHAGAPWTTITTHLRLGNLNGFLGYTTDKYGIAIGSTNAYLKYDPTNGLRIKGDIDVSSMYALPSDENLVGYWPLDDGGGTVAVDGSGNDNNGGLVGNPTWDAGVVGQCLDFGGSGDYVSVSHDTLFNFGTNSFSVSLYLNFNTGATQQRWSIGKGNPYIYAAGWGIVNYTAQDPVTPSVYFSDGVNRAWKTFSAMNRGTWYHLVFVVNRSTNKIETYVDSEYIGYVSISGYGSVNSPDDLLIGAGATTNDFSDCKIDEVRIYDTALTANEINALYLYPAGSGSTRISGGQITTGSIKSNNWAAAAGMQIDLDNALITVRESDGLQIDGSGGIKVLAGGNVIFGGHDSTPGNIIFQGSSYNIYMETDGTGNMTSFYPSSATVPQLYIGTTAKGWKRIHLLTSGNIYLTAYKNATNYAYIRLDSESAVEDIVMAVSNGGTPVAYTFRNNAIIISSHKTVDFATSLMALDDAYADDWHNVADFYNFDIHDDLAAINGISGSGVIDDRTGNEIIDDSTLPLWLLSKYKQDGEIREQIKNEKGDIIEGKILSTYKKGDIMYDPDGKPYLSLKACISIVWGAIRQLDNKIEAANEKIIN